MRFAGLPGHVLSSGAVAELRVLTTSPANVPRHYVDLGQNSVAVQKQTRETLVNRR
jgi:hypothetical protein